jgi:elongation factor Ts
MQITAALVKEVRERTGAGMMECKRALVDAAGDIDAAIEAMRKAGLAKADKKAGRIAAEGLIGIESSRDGQSGAMVEVNCETDFVAKEDEFRGFVAQVGSIVLEHAPATLDALLEMQLDGGETVETRRRELVAKIGENISVRRYTRVVSKSGLVAGYLHGGRIGVLVAVDGGTPEVGKDLAMHVAASKPICIAEKDVPEAMLAKEREILVAQAADSGKPPEIVERMVTGRLKKFLGEITLLGQPFVKDPDVTVERYLAGSGARPAQFERFEVGEGMEKRSENFAEEVMAQVRGTD